jgi:hypothetical protein
MKATRQATPAALGFEASETKPAWRQRVPTAAFSHVRAFQDSSMRGAHA